MPFDFSKPMFFGVNDMPNHRGGRNLSNQLLGLSNLSLGVNPALKFKNIPFDCGNFPGNGLCCFNSMIGYPQKKDRVLPIFNYEMDMINALESGVKYLAVKKSRGSGISELMLRYMAFLGLSRNEEYKNSKMAIICGPGQSTAMDLIKRLKLMLLPLDILEETSADVARFLDVEVIAKPGSHVSTLRGYTNIKIILVDEASFWIGEEQANEIRSVAEGYIAKSGVSIVMISTPNIPGTMFETIMEEPDSLYKRYFLPYTACMEKPGQPGSGIYSEYEIQQAKLSPHFPREYELKYGIGLGNLFADADIDAILINDTELEQQRKQLDQPMHHISIGCDPGFGSSLASYVVTAQIGGKVVVLDSNAFERGSFRTFSNLMFDKFKEYRADKIFVDASARDVVDDLKQAFREDTNYEAVQRIAHREYRYDRDAWMQRMLVIPIAFNHYNDQMIHNLVNLVQNRLLLIPRTMERLILDLRMAIEKNGKLQKSNSVNTFDLLDALRMACLMYQYR
jgi:hypothetical protein